ncbi:glutaredoxin family protein [Lederbergia sp. NSJ-179]|uniref:glutaredoxin family protein n=1 Tax=Lederbergia sp. NSJ-179 TaxID=2931402 RepID=UPI001FD5E75F|nr:glutaredoxin family protein [Lederbergia sp. NSJ-179]MCJ7840238.1 glutaredoxin family protein [Lederbergia sp. NSJ-179]
MDIIFYTRKQCGLCLDAKNILLLLQHEYPIHIIERDIDTNEEWTEKYGLMIPVIEMDGEILQYGSIDLLQLEEKIKFELL